MVPHTLCNNLHRPTILRFTINVCNNQAKSLHVQNEKETNNEAGNEHTPTTMLHEHVLNHKLKTHSYPQCVGSIQVVRNTVQHGFNFF